LECGVVIANQTTMDRERWEEGGIEESKEPNVFQKSKNPYILKKNSTEKLVFLKYKDQFLM
jgi:hypothetical protein